MTAADELKDHITSVWNEHPAADASVRILDFLVKAPADELAMLTFYSFSKVLGLDQVDDIVVQAVGLLSNSSIEALELQLVFIDDEEEFFPVTKSDYAEAKGSGFFIHPRNGEEVEDFPNHIIATFKPTEKLFNVRSVK